jgi:RNA 3'-terminal phosphate cyclase (ATP)
MRRGGILASRCCHARGADELEAQMIEIDGAQQSGSGTIVRYAVAFSALLGQPLRLLNVRAKREQPGLRPQHLASVLACAELSEAGTEGLSVGAHEFTFVPGQRIRGGSFASDIGTAGSATMLALSILPLACFAAAPLTARITGGVFQDFAPSPYHMQHVLAPLLDRMGVRMALGVVRAGYVPRGAGVIELRVVPTQRPLRPLTMTEQGHLGTVRGIAFASHLEERRVSERMARTCEEYLAQSGLSAAIERVNDTEALHAGASLAVWGESSTGCLVGADRAGARGRSSEAIGRFVAEALLTDFGRGAAVDRHIADQLVLFTALAEGASRYLVPFQTDHLASNLWLASQFGARVGLQEQQVTIEGLGFWPLNKEPCRRRRALVAHSLVTSSTLYLNYRSRPSKLYPLWFGFVLIL